MTWAWSPFWVETLRWFELVGLCLLLCMGAWCMIAVTRLRQEQVVAIQTLNAMAERVIFKRVVDQIQQSL